MGELTATRRIGGLLLFVVAVVLLALPTGVLARWGLQSRYTNPYVSRPHEEVA